MVSSLPFRDFAWDDERDVDVLIEKYAIEEDIFASTEESYERVTQGCFVIVDMEYPKELHDTHSDYPLAPSRIDDER